MNLLNTIGVQLLVVVLGLIVEYFLVQPFANSRQLSVTLPGRQPLLAMAAAVGLALGVAMLVLAILVVFERLSNSASPSDAPLLFVGALTLMLLLYASGFLLYVLYRTRCTAFISYNRRSQREQDAQPPPSWQAQSDANMERLTGRRPGSFVRERQRERVRKLSGELNEGEVRGAAFVAGLATLSLFLPLVVVWLLTFVFPSPNTAVIALPLAGVAIFTYVYLNSLEASCPQCLVEMWLLASFVEWKSIRRAVVITGAIVFPPMLVALTVSAEGSLVGLGVAALAIAFLFIPLVWGGLLFICDKLAALTMFLFPHELKRA